MTIIGEPLERTWQSDEQWERTQRIGAALIEQLAQLIGKTIVAAETDRYFETVTLRFSDGSAINFSGSDQGASWEWQP